MLHPEFQSSFFSIDFKHLGLHHLAHFEHVLRMIDALLRTDVTDVNHSFNAFRDPYESAEFHNIHDRPLDHEPRRELLRSISPGIPKRLFQSQRHPALTWVHTQDHRFHCLARFHQVTRLADFFYPRHF